MYFENDVQKNFSWTSTWQCFIPILIIVWLFIHKKLGGGLSDKCTKTRMMTCKTWYEFLGNCFKKIYVLGCPYHRLEDTGSEASWLMKWTGTTETKYQFKVHRFVYLCFSFCWWHLWECKEWPQKKGNSWWRATRCQSSWYRQWTAGIGTLQWN